MPTLDFVENAAIWTFAGLLAITGTPLAAIAFLTVAPKFVIAMRTGNLGAVATIYVDGIPAAVADTYSDTPGVIRKIIFGDPDNDTHQVYVQKDDNPDTILEVIRKELSPDEITPPYIRYNVDCDCTQITTDGGATWTDSPAADPRANPGQLVPPLGTGSAQCDAAANMVAKLHDMVDADITSANALLLSSVLLDLALLAFPGAGEIADLFLIIAEAIIAIGAGTISSSFTSTVYDDLLCTFLENIGTDGQMDSSQYAALNAAVTANYDFVVSTVFNLHSQTLGFVGWSNAGALGTETGDCSSCTVPGCYEWNFVDACAQLGWGIYSGVFTGSPYCFFQQTCIGGVGSDSHVNPYIDWHTLGHIVVSHLEIDLEIIGDTSHWQMYRQQSADPGDIVLMDENDVAVGVHTVTADFSTEDWYGIDILVQTPGGCGSGDAYVKAVRIVSPNLAPIGLSPNC